MRRKERKTDFLTILPNDDSLFRTDSGVRSER